MENAFAIEAFKYPDSGKARPQLWEEIPEIAGGNPTPAKAGQPDARSLKPDQPEPEPVTAEDLQRSFETGRNQGIDEGRKQEQEAQRTYRANLEKQRIAQATEFANQFARERDRFLASIEEEVVRLSLAIAQRVLRREAQMDPLFLVGAVRVALGHLAENLHVRLRVFPGEAELWAETLSHIPNLKVRPEVVSDPAMHSDECVIESDMGSADLGLVAQLRTIQQGLLGEGRVKSNPRES